MLLTSPKHNSVSINKTQPETTSLASLFIVQDYDSFTYPAPLKLSPLYLP